MVKSETGNELVLNRERHHPDPIAISNIVAGIIRHEIAHCIGVEHTDMDREIHGCMTYKDYPAQDLPVREVKETVPCITDIVQARAEKARTMLAKHERRLKLMKTIVAKWKRKVVYYEKALGKKAASNTDSVGETT